MSDQETPKFVIAHYALSSSEAELIRVLLEENGVDAVVPDRNSPYPGIDLTPWGAAGGAGCDVYVRAEDLERAKHVIQASRDAAQKQLSDQVSELHEKISRLDRKFEELDSKLRKDSDTER